MRTRWLLANLWVVLLPLAAFGAVHISNKRDEKPTSAPEAETSDEQMHKIETTEEQMNLLQLVRLAETKADELVVIGRNNGNGSLRGRQDTIQYLDDLLWHHIPTRLAVELGIAVAPLLEMDFPERRIKLRETHPLMGELVSDLLYAADLFHNRDSVRAKVTYRYAHTVRERLRNAIRGLPR